MTRETYRNLLGGLNMTTQLNQKMISLLCKVGLAANNEEKFWILHDTVKPAPKK